MSEISGKNIFVPRNPDRKNDLKKPYLDKGYKPEEIHVGNLMPNGEADREELRKIKVVIGNVYLWGYSFPTGKIDLNIEIVTNDFVIYPGKGLKTLEGCPKHVGGLYQVRGSEVINLKGTPEHIYGTLYVADGLTSIEGCPKVIDGDLNLLGNGNLKSLEGIGKVGGRVIANRNTSKVGMKKKIKITEEQLRAVLKSRVNEMYDDPSIKISYENEISDTIGQAIDSLIASHGILNKVVDFDLDDQRNKEVLEAMNEIYTIVDKLQKVSPEAKPTQMAFKPKQ